MHASSQRVPAHPLLDRLIAGYGFKNDAGIARELHMQPPHVSKVRNGHLPVGADMVIRIHERTTMPVAKIKELAGLPRFDEKQ